MKKFFAVLLMSAVVAVGCSSDTTEKVEIDGFVEVTLAEVTHSVFYAPQYVALEMGYFEEEGLIVDFLAAQGADKTMASLLSGEVEFGLMGPESSIYVYNQESPQYAVNFAQLTKRDGSFLVSRIDEPDFEIADLAGAELIGGRAGGVPLMTVEYVVKSNGLVVGENVEAGEVNVRSDIQFDVMAGSFIGGIGDYVTLFEPTATQLENEGQGFIVASIGAESGDIPYTAYSALNTYVDKNPEIVQKFTNAIYKGQVTVQESSAEEIAEMISQQFMEISLEDLTTVIQRYKDIDAWCATPVMTQESFDKLMDVMELAGELDARADFDAIVDNSFAQIAIGE
ncbi:MAG: nitrate ABC transporter substrate-binding protein [Epulopiscium sp. Nele67-Bin002]|nr:MAG: nitrate ABC transporter substrate-binding protein [Epulopiscium sp. Nuni2H_MBin001]OON92337.1 MAG: nitrate ABC transporter substrate-binding protein [Epulopiscium sp. Nele67-Bin002]